ncbi:hypothetical protein GPECTOR_2g1067 [Gonium pectorale]|uniref:Uncharacterized protein n=1 Tax=Gonium pectorale TaxID=33097 RepID=A0A150H0X3_GONPE|nr:hypothetical protein GPECTOR_2g1067 [Gonium pectorale]|eukprot:KXZ55518.1 hypothetical protein GPECTOR_2g1067 [Gonium pectorale]
MAVALLMWLQARTWTAPLEVLAGDTSRLRELEELADLDETVSGLVHGLLAETGGAMGMPPASRATQQQSGYLRVQSRVRDLVRASLHLALRVEAAAGASPKRPVVLRVGNAFADGPLVELAE